MVRLWPPRQQSVGSVGALSSRCVLAPTPSGTTLRVHLVPGPKVQHALGLLRGHQVVAAEQAQCVAAAGIVLKGGQECAGVNIPAHHSASGVRALLCIKQLAPVVKNKACKVNEGVRTMQKWCPPSWTRQAQPAGLSSFTSTMLCVSWSAPAPC